LLQGKRRNSGDTAVFYVTLGAGIVAGGTSSFLVTPLDGMSEILRICLVCIQYTCW